MSHFEHGAINKETNHLTDPISALQRTWYKCPDCHRDVNVKKGEKRLPHFAHRPDVTNPCTYYNRNPTLDQRHRNAQLKLKQFLERCREITIGRKCICGCGIVSNWGITCSINNAVKCEHRFKFNDSNKSADVAVVDPSGKIVCIFEVVHTHYTQERDRPEPWHEVRADEINAIPSNAENITIACIRQKIRPECIAKQTLERELRAKLLEEERVRNEEWRMKMEAQFIEDTKRWKAKEQQRQKDLEVKMQLRRTELELQRQQYERDSIERKRLAIIAEAERKVAEEKERESKRILSDNQKALFKKHAAVVQRCERCGPMAIWLGAGFSIGRCYKCVNKINELVKQDVETTVQTMLDTRNELPL
jgi:hypothetical protein